MLSAICAKNSALESSLSTPGILSFLKSDMAAQPSSSNETRQERKFVPPASMTMTRSFFGREDGGSIHVRIMSCPAFLPESPCLISLRIAPAAAPTSIPTGKLCLIKKDAAFVVIFIHSFSYVLFCSPGNDSKTNLFYSSFGFPQGEFPPDSGARDEGREIMVY